MMQNKDTGKFQRFKVSFDIFSLNVSGTDWSACSASSATALKQNFGRSYTKIFKPRP